MKCSTLSVLNLPFGKERQGIFVHMQKYFAHIFGMCAEQIPATGWWSLHSLLPSRVWKIVKLDAGSSGHLKLNLGAWEMAQSITVFGMQAGRLEFRSQNPCETLSRVVYCNSLARSSQENPSGLQPVYLNLWVPGSLWDPVSKSRVESDWGGPLVLTPDSHTHMHTHMHTQTQLYPRNQNDLET